MRLIPMRTAPFLLRIARKSIENVYTHFLPFTNSDQCSVQILLYQFEVQNFSILCPEYVFQYQDREIGKSQVSDVHNFQVLNLV